MVTELGQVFFQLNIIIILHSEYYDVNYSYTFNWNCCDHRGIWKSYAVNFPG